MTPFQTISTFKIVEIPEIKPTTSCSVVRHTDPETNEAVWSWIYSYIMTFELTPKLSLLSKHKWSTKYYDHMK